jgi:DNA-binding NarL/FixJ family response regulator
MDGVLATRIIRREFPESQVVIVSQNDPKLVARQAAEVDASGYVAKSDLPHHCPHLTEYLPNATREKDAQYKRANPARTSRVENKLRESRKMPS